MENNLKELRVKAGLTQEELANLIGSKKQYISALETGLRNISTIRNDTMKCICSALNCSTEDLVNNDGIFEFDSDGNLIVDKIYVLNGNYIIAVKDFYFIAPPLQVYYSSKNVKNITEHLRPFRGLINKKVSVVDSYAIYNLLGCVPRDGIDVEIGRAITKDELDDLLSEYNITEENITDTFIDQKGEIYGKYAKSYTAIQIKVEDTTPVELEHQLTQKGIEASAINPQRINIRVK